MKSAKVNQTYNILSFNEDMELDSDSPTADVEVDQFKGDDLEIWKEREDGFLFVYCNRLEIGYWVMPSHITVLK